MQTTFLDRKYVCDYSKSQLRLSQGPFGFNSNFKTSRLYYACNWLEIFMSDRKLNGNCTELSIFGIVYIVIISAVAWRQCYSFVAIAHERSRS